MAQLKDPALGINSWLEDELYHQYQFDQKSVDEGWSHLFQNGAKNQSSAATAAVAEPPEVEEAPETPAEAASSQPAPEQPRPAQSPLEQPRSEQPEPATPVPPPRAPGAELTTTSTQAPAKAETTKALGASDQLVPLRGVAARIAENMAASLAIPVATSQRQIPMRVIEENRNIINKRRGLQGRSK